MCFWLPRECVEREWLGFVRNLGILRWLWWKRILLCVQLTGNKMSKCFALKFDIFFSLIIQSWGEGIWTLDTFVGNTKRCQLSYKALGIHFLFLFFNFVLYFVFKTWNLNKARSFEPTLGSKPQKLDPTWHLYLDSWKLNLYHEMDTLHFKVNREDPNHMVDWVFMWQVFW